MVIGLADDCNGQVFTQTETKLRSKHGYLTGQQLCQCDITRLRLAIFCMYKQSDSLYLFGLVGLTQQLTVEVFLAMLFG